MNKQQQQQEGKTGGAEREKGVVEETRIIEM